MVGTLLAHYRVTGKLGIGGMGVVYDAEDTRLPRRGALKFLPQELAGYPEASRRLQREAETIALLNHPNICTDPTQVTATIARRNADRARRRAGLFASGDLLTAIAQTAAELDLPIALPLRGSEGLRELCANPDVAELYDLAIQREYAESRWRRASPLRR